ncbi:MAG: prolyl oligopeptidase family serine peptidase [Acidobacteriota bacterium]|nr:prolyl oligopeptidase family serine peptidase [Acidobacteriota bacterium]
MTKKSPYGTWESPINTEDLTSRTVTLSQLRVDGQSTMWVEGRPNQGGRNVLLRRDPLGQTEEVLPMIEESVLPDVRTRVHEYGGRAYAVHEGVVVFSHAKDDRVYRYDLNNPSDGIIPLTELSNRRYGDFEIAEVRGIVYAVCEDHTVEGEPENYLVSIPLDGSGARDSSLIHRIFEGTDFVMAPTLSTDGTKLAWVTWNHPQMPWTQSQLHVASVDFDGEIIEKMTLVDEEGVAVYEPRWTLTGDLIHVDDSNGWANLYRTEGFEWRENEGVNEWMNRLRTRRLHPSERAFSHPHWQLGLHSYDNLDEEHLICSWTEEAFWHVGTVRLDNGQLEAWDVDWWPVGNVAADGGRVVMLADSATETPAIVEIQRGEVQILRSSTWTDLPEDLVSKAEAIDWPTSDGEEAHGFFYAPSNPEFEGPEDELPPLIVMVHGGPTSAARPGLSLFKQFWTSRGFAILDVNHRGSTGWGRPFRERLNGNWGVMDVNDAADGVRFLVKEGKIDSNRVAIRGGSAGGFTTLSALATSDVFTAGTSLYGIADLKKLAAETHKFESRYLGRMLGAQGPDDPVWEERSPITKVENIKAPLLLLQGSEDKVVPQSQAELIKDALEKEGKTVELKVYEGEGHGFVKGENIRDSIETELDFYRKTWGIS